jgi:hypothetical protein
MTHFLPFLLFLGYVVSAQSYTVYRENGKRGVKYGGKVVVPATYDTVFGFDPSGRVCMACHRVTSATSSKFIKVTSTSYVCNYLNAKNTRLVIRNRAGDTCSVFSLAKNSVSDYTDGAEIFAVTARSKKFLVTKDFKQLTYKGYHGIAPSDEPAFYITETVNDAEAVLSGVVNTREEQVVPNSYTSVRINPFDSLIVGCSAGLGNATDDVYDYSGKRIASYARHVDQATRHFIIHKMFEPGVHYIIYNIATREEKKLAADEVQLAPPLLRAMDKREEIRIRVKNDWFLYDMRTHQKKPLKQT